MHFVISWNEISLIIGHKLIEVSEVVLAFIIFLFVASFSCALLVICRFIFALIGSLGLGLALVKVLGNGREETVVVHRDKGVLILAYKVDVLK